MGTEDNTNSARPRNDRSAVRPDGTHRDAEQCTLELTYSSPAGIYVVLTRSGALYVVDLHDADAAPVITRYSVGRELLFDAQPLPGVIEFRFDVEAGKGVLVWSKPDPSTRWAVPGYSYIGTIRRTSTPIWIGRIQSSLLDDLPVLLREVRRRGGFVAPNERPDA